MTSATTLPPKIKVNINGQRMILDTTQVLGDGGEGIVIKIQLSGKDYAAKIIHPSMRTATRAKKLAAQIKRRPPMTSRCIAPMHLIENEQGQVVGHCMELVDLSQFDDLIWWMKDSFRQKENIEFKDVCAVFLELRNELEALHNAGYVIGDFNPGGIKVMKKALWNKANEGKRLWLVDADCMEFDSFACPVFSLAYLDYKLAPRMKELGKAGIYSKMTDYFAFDAMFFEALTLAGVYDGWHDLYDGTRMKFARGLTVLNKDVEYPDDALPLASLPPDFQKHFKSSFVDGKRELFPVSALSAALGIQIVKQKPVQQRANAKLRIHDVLCTNLGHIMDYSVSGEMVVLLTKATDDKLYLVTCYNSEVKAIYVTDSVQGHDYWLLNNRMVAHWSPRYDHLTYIDSKKGEEFAVQSIKALNDKPLVAGSSHSLFAASNNYLFATDFGKDGTVDYGNRQNLHMVNSNTALRHDPATGNIMGYVRTGMLYNWFFVRNGRAYDIQLDNLDDTETMDEVAVRWGENTALVLRLTTYKGVQRTHYDEVNLSSTAVGSRHPYHGVDDVKFKPLHGCAYIRNGNGEAVIMYATQGGIARENLYTSESTIFAATKGAVRRGDKLLPYKQGLLVIGSDEVSYIAL